MPGETQEVLMQLINACHDSVVRYAGILHDARRAGDISTVRMYEEMLNDAQVALRDFMVQLQDGTD